MIEPFGLEPEAALEQLRRRGANIRPGWDHRDIWKEEHTRAFTLAGVARFDVMLDVRQTLDEALAGGWTMETFRAKMRERLEAKGWWKPQEVPDFNGPTGATKLVDLSAPWRVQTIFRTNMRVARAKGQWEAIEQDKEFAPFLRYSAIRDSRTRPEHAGWHGTILPVDHPWWRTHFPPNGWNCRCSVIQMSQDDLDADGLAVTPAPATPTRPWLNKRTGEIDLVPRGIDPGWDYNVGLGSGNGGPDYGLPRIQTQPGFAPRGPADYGLPRAAEVPDPPREPPRLSGGSHESISAEDHLAQVRRQVDDVFGTAPAPGPGLPDIKAVLSDPTGETVAVSRQLADHITGMDRRAPTAARPARMMKANAVAAQQRPRFLPHFRATIEAPDEVWLLYHATQAGAMAQKRYIKFYAAEGGGVMAVEVDVSVRGGEFVVATAFVIGSDPDARRSGYLIYRSQK